jgi:hypothetical protein
VIREGVEMDSEKAGVLAKGSVIAPLRRQTPTQDGASMRVKFALGWISGVCARVPVSWNSSGVKMAVSPIYLLAHLCVRPDGTVCVGCFSQCHRRFPYLGGDH